MRAFVLGIALAGCAKHDYPSGGEDAEYRQSGNPFGAEGRGSKDDGDYGGYPSAPPPPPPPPPPMVAVDQMEQAPPRSEPAVNERAPEVRMVHYSGWMTLRVTQVKEELDRLSQLAKDTGGRVESLSTSAIVLRIPVAKYRETWEAIQAHGDVLEKAENAEDVTESFTAVDLRVKTATITRDRLVALLARAESEDDKILLLQQIQRVTEELDALESQLRTLRGLADYSRITVQVVPKGAFVAGGAVGPDVAGFQWIRELSPFQRYIGADERRLELTVPDGMVELSPRGAFVAESPEGAVLWTGRVTNDPQADAGFWVAAVHERLDRDFASATESDVGDWRCVRFVAEGETPYSWDVCVRAGGDEKRLELAQAYYPDDASYQRYRDGVRAALGGSAASASLDIEYFSGGAL